MNITFEKAALKYKDIIFQWLEEPHIQEFWDNSQEHKDDIINFINGRKEPSNYFYGTIDYWIGLINEKPFAFVLSDRILPSQASLSELHRKHLSVNGNTITLDFGIGNKEFLSQGLAAPTLQAFMEFYRSNVDKSADIFFIDPDDNNPRAARVYSKAGFVKVGEFEGQGKYWDFSGDKTYLMVKKYEDGKLNI